METDPDIENVTSEAILSWARARLMKQAAFELFGLYFWIDQQKISFFSFAHGEGAACYWGWGRDCVHRGPEAKGKVGTGCCTEKKEEIEQKRKKKNLCTIQHWHMEMKKVERGVEPRLPEISEDELQNPE